MYKEFGTLEDLCHEIEVDKLWTGAESSLRNRYPIRFVLFENFGDFGAKATENLVGGIDYHPFFLNLRRVKGWSFVA